MMNDPSSSVVVVDAMVDLGHEAGAVRADRERALVLAVVDRRGDDRLLVLVAVLEARKEMRAIAPDRTAEGEAGVLPIVGRASARSAGRVASQAPGRTNRNPLPCRSLVPLLVITETMPDIDWPYSAEN